MGEEIFVTGGSGFVGAAIVRALVAAGHRVRALARSDASAAALSALGAVPVRGDLLDAASLRAGVEGATVVVHAAASLTSAVRYADHERINVEGTWQVLSAAKQASVRRFIHVSAASIVIDGDHPTDGDESLPVRFHRSMPYSATKGLAEQLVLAESGPSMLTLALRPPLVWGEGAPSIDRIGEAFREGRFVWIGGGQFPYSVCHVDNLASAVVQSVERGRGGEAYFVTDDETSTMKAFFTALMEAAGHPSKARAVPYWFAAVLGRIVGLVFSVLRPRQTPPLTLENVRLIGHTLRVSNARARRELGYVPRVRRADGLARMRSARGEPMNEAPAGGLSRGASARALAILLLVLSALGATSRVRAAGPDADPSGLWQLVDDKTGQPNGVVRLTVEDGTLRGRIERLRPGTQATDKCTKCPPPQKDRPFLGLMIAWGLKPDGDSWGGGTILDPDSGDTYRCIMKLHDRNTLEVRGYIGISLFGRTQRWTRTQ